MRESLAAAWRRAGGFVSSGAKEAVGRVFLVLTLLPSSPSPFSASTNPSTFHTLSSSQLPLLSSFLILLPSAFPQNLINYSALPSLLSNHSNSCFSCLPLYIPMHPSSLDLSLLHFHPTTTCLRTSYKSPDVALPQLSDLHPATEPHYQAHPYKSHKPHTPHLTFRLFFGF